MLEGKRDVETVLTMGIMEDVSIIPQPAGNVCILTIKRCQFYVLTSNYTCQVVMQFLSKPYISINIFFTQHFNILPEMTLYILL